MTTTKDKTAGDRQRRLIENNDKRGLIQIRAWVPKERRDEALALLAQWRAEFKLES